MKTIRAWIMALAMATSPQMAAAKLNVVATTPDFASVAEAVGGNEIQITTLVRPTEDPHFIEPKPSFVVKLSRADVLIEGGAELEVGWLPPLLQRAGNRKLATGQPGRVVANRGVEMLEVPNSLDRSQGDIHALGNPHFLVDPLNARLFAQKLAETFAALDPGQAETYRANAKKFTDTLDARLAEWQKRLEPFKGRAVVGYHNSWPYFARRFDLKIDLFLEPKPGLPPTPGHLSEVIAAMKQRDVRVIIVDHYVDHRTAETVAKRTGATVVEVTHYPGGVKGTETGYLALLDYLVTSIAKAFESK